MSRYPGTIKDPDPPSRGSGAIVGNHLKHVALGTLYFRDYADIKEGCIAEGIHSTDLTNYLKKQMECYKSAAPVFIYINNLGYKLKEDFKVTFDIQVIDPDPLTIVAINIVPDENQG